MQTFIVDHDLKKSFSLLDSKRLGKQRVETIQIARTLLGLSTGWSNHPAVRMWSDYEGFLVRDYLDANLDEWFRRGFRSGRCEQHEIELICLVASKPRTKPFWITDEFIDSHRSNLIRKDPMYYRPIWPDLVSNLPYVWPSKKA